MNRDYLIKLSKERGEPAWLTERRLEALATYDSAEPPTFKYGLGVNFSASRVILPDGEPTAPEVDVKLPDGWQLEPLGKTLLDAPVRETYLNLAEIDDNRVAQVVAWQMANGVGESILFIPGGFASSEPVRLSLRGSGNTAHRLIIDVGSSADVDLVIVAEAGGTVARQIDVNARSGSSLNLLLNFSGDAQSFNAHRIHVGTGAHVALSVVQSGGAFSQLRINTRLAGEQSAFRYRAFMLGNGRGMVDESCEVTHGAVSTHADVRCGVVLGGGDKAISHAKMRLEPDVSGSTAVQRSAALLLAEGAEYAAKPEFEARHDQLQCAHGAAVSGLDSDRLFYLMSRGLNRREAASVLVDSFADAYLGDFSAAGLSDEVADIMIRAKKELITGIK